MTSRDSMVSGELHPFIALAYALTQVKDGYTPFLEEMKLCLEEFYSKTRLPIESEDLATMLLWQTGIKVEICAGLLVRIGEVAKAFEDSLDILVQREADANAYLLKIFKENLLLSKETKAMHVSHSEEMSALDKNAEEVARKTIKEYREVALYVELIRTAFLKLEKDIKLPK